MLSLKACSNTARENVRLVSSIGTYLKCRSSIQNCSIDLHAFFPPKRLLRNLEIKNLVYFYLQTLLHSTFFVQNYQISSSLVRSMANVNQSDGNTHENLDGAAQDLNVASNVRLRGFTQSRIPRPMVLFPVCLIILSRS